MLNLNMCIPQFRQQSGKDRCFGTIYDHQEDSDAQMNEPATKAELVDALILIRDVQSSVITGIVSALKTVARGEDSDEQLGRFLEVYDENNSNINKLISVLKKSEAPEKDG